jgi:hypothetical protein
MGIAVVPLVGPISLLLALASSGLNGQNFAFVGYLPQEPQERSKRIKELEQLALKTGQTQLFIETPYRNAAIWTSLVQTLQAQTRLSFSSGISLPQAIKVRLCSNGASFKTPHRPTTCQQDSTTKRPPCSHWELDEKMPFALSKGTAAGLHGLPCAFAHGRAKTFDQTFGHIVVA